MVGVSATNSLLVDKTLLCSCDWQPGSYLGSGLVLWILRLRRERNVRKVRQESKKSTRKEMASAEAGLTAAKDKEEEITVSGVAGPAEIDAFRRSVKQVQPNAHVVPQIDEENNQTLYSIIYL